DNRITSNPFGLRVYGLYVFDYAQRIFKKVKSSKERSSRKCLTDSGISLLWTTNGDFPYATFIVNVIGCFFIGFFMNNRRLKHFLHPHVLTGIQTGFIGSFTTYSTFAMETIQLWHKHQQFLAISYVLMSVFGGALCYVLGCQVTTRKRRRSL